MAILVVEDDPGIRQGIADFLGFEGYAVDVAVNGEEALTYLRQRRPSVLVLDLVMPVMNGPQLLERLRSERIADGVPVAIMTSVAYGAHYLARNREMLGGDLYAALAADNGGPGNAAAWQELAQGDPDLFLESVRAQETRDYIRRIYEIYVVYRRLYGAAP